MATIRAVSVVWGVTVQVKQFEPVRIEVEMTADLERDDNPETVLDELAIRAKTVIAQQLAVMTFPAAKFMAQDLLKDIPLPDDEDLGLD